MKTLILDASSSSASVACAEDEKLLYEGYLSNGLTHSSHLMPLVEDAMSYAGLDIADIDLFGCIVGPGSFTGVRIGVATVKGLMGDKKCVELDGLHALALQAGDFDGLVCPILDARAGQVYAALFENGARVSEDQPVKLEELLDELRKTGKKVLFLGDGVPVQKERLLKEDFARLAPSSLWGLHASSALPLLLQNADKAVSAEELRPLCLRAPSAQRAKEGKLHG